MSMRFTSMRFTSMRFTRYTAGLALGATALGFAGCFDTEQTCEDLANCPGGRAGAGGGSGTAGATGARGGSAATAGSGADGGTTGGGSAAGGSSGRGGNGALGGDSGSGGEGGMDGGAGMGERPCDATKTPGEDSCVIHEDYGVFVSAAGDDAKGDGSRARPFATLAKAIDEATSADKRVYACADAGPFREQETLELGKTASGLEVYGGFACDDWTYSTSAQSRVASKAALALHVSRVTGLRVEDLRIEAADGAEPGESSIGVFVASSTDVVFRRVRIEAGAGMAGADGTREDFEFPAREELDGNSTTDSSGADEKVCDCPGGSQSIGGIGGKASLTGGQAGGAGGPDYPGAGGEPGMPGSCTAGVGRDGASAPEMTPAPGASMTGTFDASGWIAAPGNDGPPGSPGQGGGGGASSTTGGGGGGGCGACGGAGGKGGQGGGASIALAVFESAVTLESADLLAADGGSGGSGIQGQSAQTEAGVIGNGALGGCPGGAGGLGADGGPSGGGAGGISAGIVWKGDAPPQQTKVNINIGAPGAKGIGGKPGVNDGIVGDAQDVLEAP